MNNPEEAGLLPAGAQGAHLKHKITKDKDGVFDPGMSTLGTDNEAGAMPDTEGMAQARKAPDPAPPGKA